MPILGLFFVIAVVSGAFALLPHGGTTPASLRDYALNLSSEFTGIFVAVVFLEPVIRWHQDLQTQRTLESVLAQTQALAQLISEDTKKQGFELNIDDQMKLTRQVAWTHNLLATSTQLQVPAWERQTLPQLLDLQRLVFEYQQLTEQLKSCLVDETHPLVVKRYMTERLQVCAALIESESTIRRTLHEEL